MRNTVLLDGVWDFAFAEGMSLEEMVPGAVELAEPMPVPCCFDASKRYFGKLGSAAYGRKVRCGGKVRLKIEALGLRGKVFWDGRKIGICEHPFSPEIFDFYAGENALHDLFIAVENIPHGPEEGKMFLLDYDFYGYGGIYDSVTLTELPEFFIDSIQTIPLDLEGNVKIRLFLGGKIPSSGYEAAISFDGKETVVLRLSGASPEFVCKVPCSRVWTMEKPFLHLLSVELEKERKLDYLETTFGIRLLEARDQKIFLNGRAIRLVGYNRHDSCPGLGYALPAAMMVADLQAIKDQGCNFIRGCHYPQRQKFLDLCDRMGLLVWEEVIGWNNRPAQCRNADFARFQLEQARAMVRKSANHPSVILWGFLNEVWMPEDDTPRPLIEAMVRQLKQDDPSRLVTFAFATGWMGNDDCLELADVLSFNTYPGWYGWWEKPECLFSVVPKLKELADFASCDRLKEKPLIISEIGAAALYGFHDRYRWGEEYQEELLAAALEETFDNPRYCGIVFWHFADAKTHIAANTSSVLTRPRGYNNKGLLDEYRRPKQAWRRVGEILKKRGFDGYMAPPPEKKN